MTSPSLSSPTMAMSVEGIPNTESPTAMFRAAPPTTSMLCERSRSSSMRASPTTATRHVASALVNIRRCFSRSAGNQSRRHDDGLRRNISALHPGECPLRSQLAYPLWILCNDRDARIHHITEHDVVEPNKGDSLVQLTLPEGTNCPQGNQILHREDRRRRLGKIENLVRDASGFVLDADAADLNDVTARDACSG